MHPIEHAAAQLAHATRRELELEEQRPLIKATAIKRLMEVGAATSATAAEKIVEGDPEYAAHRAAQIDAVVDRIRARGSYDAAVASAQQQITAQTLETLVATLQRSRERVGV